MFAISAVDFQKAMATNYDARARASFDARGLAGRASLSARCLGSIERSAVAASVTVGDVRSSVTVDPCKIDQRAGAPLIGATGSRVAASAISLARPQAALADGVKFGRNAS